ncbi:XRE family transcriptional regulator [Comamonas sp. J-3]|uniref:XRE family transcriptional regulator n=1 Tax=Comamonas trifloxystrobinivorans TaxID=3350256 RepID=UPI00372B7379
MNTIAERLKQAREELGLTQPELAAKAKVSQGTIGNIETGLRKRPRELLAIASALGVDPAWLESGKGHKQQAQSASVAVTNLSPTPQPGTPAVHIPLLANAGSMGPGTDVEHDDVMVGSLAISPDWLDKRIRPSSHDALRFIHAYGDSMYPTFEDGDILLVDTGRRDPSMADGVYVLGTGKRLFIKRVTERFDGSRIVSSDNKNVPLVQELNGDSEIDVLGRVVWVWNGRKL